MLNLIDASSRDAIMSRADASKTFDLSVDFFMGMPGWFGAGDQPYQIWMTHTPGGEVNENSQGLDPALNAKLGYSGDAIAMYTHCGTHIDALNHWGYGDKVFNHFNTREHLGSRHWRKAGADAVPPIIARGVLLDVAGLHGVETLPESYGITPDDIKACLRRQKISIEVGDVVLIRTGQINKWPDISFVSKTPGITRATAEFICKHGAIMIGADNLCLEQSPSTQPGNHLPVHTYMLAEAGVPILEMAQLEEIAAEKLYEFVFVGACLKLRGATGSPIRPIAMPIRA
jgi:kynurenine formamidase